MKTRNNTSMTAINRTLTHRGIGKRVKWDAQETKDYHSLTKRVRYHGGTIQFRNRVKKTRIANRIAKESRRINRNT